MNLGFVMDGKIVLMVEMKRTVLLLLVKIKVYGIVVMDSVFLQAMYVMVPLIRVTQAGVLTVRMALMKV